MPSFPVGREPTMSEYDQTVFCRDLNSALATTERQLGEAEAYNRMINHFSEGFNRDNTKPAVPAPRIQQPETRTRPILQSSSTRKRPSSNIRARAIGTRSNAHTEVVLGTNYKGLAAAPAVIDGRVVKTPTNSVVSKAGGRHVEAFGGSKQDVITTKPKSITKPTQNLLNLSIRPKSASKERV